MQRCQCDALLFATRQVRRFSIEQVREVDAHQVARPLIFRLREGVELRGFLPEQEIRKDVRSRLEVGIQGVVLEHHADATVTRGNVNDVQAVVTDLSRIERQQSGDDLQECCLAAAAGPEDHHRFAVANAEVHIAERERRATPVVTIRQRLADIDEIDPRHPSLSALRIRARR